MTWLSESVTQTVKPWENCKLFYEKLWELWDVYYFCCCMVNTGNLCLGKCATKEKHMQLISQIGKKNKTFKELS